jgi:hypothetical protein
MLMPPLAVRGEARGGRVQTSSCPVGELASEPPQGELRSNGSGQRRRERARVCNHTCFGPRTELMKTRMLFSGVPAPTGRWCPLLGRSGLLRSMRLICPALGLVVAVATGPFLVRPQLQRFGCWIFESNPPIVEQRNTLLPRGVWCKNYKRSYADGPPPPRQQPLMLSTYFNGFLFVLLSGQARCRRS